MNQPVVKGVLEKSYTCNGKECSEALQQQFQLMISWFPSGVDSYSLRPCYGNTG